MKIKTIFQRALLSYLPRVLVMYGFIGLGNRVTEGLLAFLLNGSRFSNYLLLMLRSSSSSSSSDSKALDDVYENKRVALRDCVLALSTVGLRPFLAYGTLLGAVRDHRFLSWDGDVDLGVFDSDIRSLSCVISQLKKSGFKLLYTPVYKKNDRFKLRHFTGICLDVVLFRCLPNGAS